MLLPPSLRSVRVLRSSRVTLQHSAHLHNQRMAAGALARAVVWWCALCSARGLNPHAAATLQPSRAKSSVSLRGAARLGTGGIPASLGVETSPSSAQADEPSSGESEGARAEPLLLSPYLARGAEGAAAARAAAAVHGLKVPSYAGFLSPSATHHLFFWYFPKLAPSDGQADEQARESEGEGAGADAPLLVWLQVRGGIIGSVLPGKGDSFPAQRESASSLLFDTLVLLGSCCGLEL